MFFVMVDNFSDLKVDKPVESVVSSGDSFDSPRCEWGFFDDYARLVSDFGLPDFDVLAEDFDVEKVLDKETQFVARELRRVVSDKFTSYLHFFETLINPASPPMFVFSLLRTMSSDDKDLVKSLYNKFSRSQVRVMKLDTVYSEESEVSFVLDAYNLWQEVKPSILGIIDRFDENFDDNGTSSQKGYFG